MTDRSPRAALALVVTVTVVLSVVLSLLHLPSAVLFASLIGGMAHALTSRTVLELPAWSYRLAQGAIGVVIGAAVSLPALRRIGHDALPIGLVMVATLALSVAAGRLLALRRDVSPVTGVFSLIAGGASGVVAVARDLGADERVVTVVQYLRVLVVLLTMPVVTAVVFHPERGQGSLSAADAGLPRDLVFVVVSLALGSLLARLVRFPTAALLGPLAVAVALALSGRLGDVQVPTAVQYVAFALIGVQVGLRFTRASLAAITRMLPVVLALIVGMVVATALVGALLAWATPVDGLTAYLATTPGGLFAVLSTAADAGSDVTYVLAVQLCRLLVILALTPLLARWLSSRRG
ncbi:AbrB family transcriptional regulator [Nocardioides anomalus]|uniref:AbrB family transcriptional regulator n=1 Tax=Nocardioides anomalus TaxID=2712223 RepID=A0A6G6WCS8_9ACTN|nr:AbrB family transcriptional regulator [Nocardioides anomalus]QIG42957.1 AbrB family transcriptional regulator [Nocardioides anomalus]